MIQKFATVAMILIFVIMMTYYLLRSLFQQNSDGFWSHATVKKVVDCGIIAIVILIVSIPEGLPLAISIAMAMSIDNLKDDKVLISNLESIQNCATLHELCVSKTGTLTVGKLRVGHILMPGREFKQDRTD